MDLDVGGGLRAGNGFLVVYAASLGGHARPGGWFGCIW